MTAVATTTETKNVTKGWVNVLDLLAKGRTFEQVRESINTFAQRFPEGSPEREDCLALRARVVAAEAVYVAPGPATITGPVWDFHTDSWATGGMAMTAALGHRTEGLTRQARLDAAKKAAR